jgi:DnaJ-class molecular chaperone
MAQDYYKLLEVSPSATQEEIQKSYRKLARKYHPDLNPDDKSAQQKFKDIQHAYDVLSEPEKRRMYDQVGPDFEKMGPRGGAGGGFEDIFGGAGPGGFQFDGDLGDIFRQFGGGGAPGAGRTRGRPQAPSKGRDLTAEITVPFSTSILGGQASITVVRGGKNESIQLKIPPGIESGKKMRLRGQGESPIGGGPAGDLLVTVTVASHPFFKRSGMNLELKLPVTFGEAVLGATVDVPTPNGHVSLKIPPGSSGGRRLRITGQGVLSPTGSPGDLFVELQIRLPEQLAAPDSIDMETQKAIELIDKLYSHSPRNNIIW